MKDNKRFNPYYKSRNLESQKELMSFRIPYELKRDLEKYFKETNQSRTDGMNNLIYDFLNSHCFERKSFAFGIYIMALKPFDLTIDDLVILGIQDGYQTMNDDVFNADAILNEDAESFEHLITKPNKVEYLEYDHIGLNNLKNVAFNNYNIYFDNFTINFDLFQNKKEYIENGDPKSFIGFLEKKYAVDLDETFFVNLTINNYLDIKADGMFKATAMERDDSHHKGLNVIVDGHGKEYYIIYDWIYTNDHFRNNISIQNFEFISREQFFEVIENSTNLKLKNYVKSFDDFADVHVIHLESRIDIIDSQIKDLERQKRELESKLNE